MASQIGRRLASGAAVRYVRLQEVTSTFDACREVLRAEPSLAEAIVAVSAEVQTAGRGTSGRTWASPSGNMFLTVAVPKPLVADDVLPVFPLLVGVAVTATVTQLLTVPAGSQRDGPTTATARPKVEAKWPNDVMIDREKVSGCLIEDNGEHLLVGVGINIQTAPLTADGGRRTTCIKQHNADAVDAGSAVELCTNTLVRMTAEFERRSAVVDAYRRLMAWDCEMYCREPDGSRGAKVKPVEIGEFGEITVAKLDSGERLVLVADYLI